MADAGPAKEAAAAAAPENQGSGVDDPGPDVEPEVENDDVRTETFLLSDKQGRLPLSTKLHYGAPGFATTSLSFLIAVYANDFYVAMGAGLSFLSFFTALARSFDVMTDPLMGWVSDRTRTDHGRRRPFILTGAPFYGLFFLLLFWPPPQYPRTVISNDPYPDGFTPGNLMEGSDVTATSNMAAAYWFGFFYTIFYFCDTYSNVPYEALGPELSDSHEERNKLFFTAKIFNFMGMLFAAGAPATGAYFIRKRGQSTEEVLCSDFYNPATVNDVNAQHGTLAAGMLAYQDTDPATGQPVSLQAEHCAGSQGAFCFEEWYFNGTRLYFEANAKVIEDHCQAGSNATSDDAGCMATFGSTSCATFSKYEVSALQSQQQSYILVAAVFGFYYVMTQWNMVRKIKERPASVENKAPVPLVPSILRAFQNGAFRPLLAAWALDGLGLSALVSMFPFFIRYVVIPDGVKAKYPMDSSVCMALSVFSLLLAAMVSSAGWLWLSGKLGKYKAWLVYNAVNAATNILFLWPEEGDPFYTIFVMGLNGIPVGGQFLINSITSDVIDYDEFLNGSRSEGAFSVFATLIPKFVSIPAGALPLAIVNMLGFVPPVNGVTVEQSQTVKGFIRYTFVLVPFACAVGAFFIKLKFPIKTSAQNEAINNGIKLHLEGKEAQDPLTDRWVKLLEITPDEEHYVWQYENFSVKDLSNLKEAKSGHHIVQKMKYLTGIGVVAEIIFIIIVGATFGELENPKASIVPILGVIGVGMTACFMTISYMRLRGAKALHAETLDHEEGGERWRQQERLLDMVIHAKMTGARAGSFNEAREKFVRATKKMKSALAMSAMSRGASHGAKDNQVVPADPVEGSPVQLPALEGGKA